MLGLLAFVGVAVSTPWRQNAEWVTFRDQLRSLRDGLNRKSDPDALLSLAGKLQSQLQNYRSYAAEAHFLVGSAHYWHGLKNPGKKAHENWAIAIDQFERALAIGVTDSDKSALDYRLGYSLIQERKDIPRALNMMLPTIESEADNKLSAYRMLLDVQLKQAKPNLDTALALSGRVVELLPDSDPEALAKARFQRSDLLMKKGQRTEAIHEIRRIDAKAPRPLRIKARLLQAQCHEEEGDWPLAMSIWKELLKDAAHVEGGRARILYALGWCHHQIRPPNPKETIRVWSEAAKIPGPEGQAAALNLGELRLTLGAAQADLAIADWASALETVKSPADYKNPYLSLEQVTGMFQRGLNHFQETNEPQKAQVIAELYRRVAKGGVVEKQVAELMERNAREMLRKSELTPNNKAILDEALAQFRQAGVAFEHAASAQPQESRSPLLWRAIECFVAGKDGAAAKKALKQFVVIEKKDARLAEAWYTLGDLYRVAGDEANAHEAFVRCVEFSSTIYACRARFYLAVEEATKKNFSQAVEILRQNLEGPSVEIDRPSHERSLFMMAFLRMRMNEPSEASIYLKNCLELYPDNPAINRVRENLGMCNLQLAKQEKSREEEQAKSRTANLPPDVRARIEDSIRASRKTRFAYLARATNVYVSLKADLEADARNRKLTVLEENLLRRAWFGLGECHLGNQEFTEAAHIFLEIQHKNRGTVEALIAAHRVLDEILVAANRTPQESTECRKVAQESLGLLKEDLKTLQPDNEIFRLPNVPTHAQFTQLTVLTQRRLDAPPMKSKSLPGFQ